MKIKHVNAKPGEYVAVHRYRNHNRSRNNADKGKGILLILCVVFIIIFWQEILITASICAVAGLTIVCGIKFYRDVLPQFSKK